MKTLKAPIILAIIFFVHLAQANGGPDLLTVIGEKYRKAGLVSADVEKVLKQTVLGKTKKQSGQFFYSKNHLRLNFEKPDRSEVIVDGKYVWLFAYPPEEMKEVGIQISKTKISKDAGAKSLLNLLALNALSDQFVIKVAKESDSHPIYELKPKKGVQMGISKATVKLDAKEQTVEEIFYWDELENETNYKFSEVKTSSSTKPKLFKAVIPKGAEVSEL